MIATEATAGTSRPNSTAPAQVTCASTRAATSTDRRGGSCHLLAIHRASTKLGATKTGCHHVPAERTSPSPPTRLTVPTITAVVMARIRVSGRTSVVVIALSRSLLSRVVASPHIHPPCEADRTPVTPCHARVVTRRHFSGRAIPGSLILSSSAPALDRRWRPATSLRVRIQHAVRWYR